MSPREPAAAGPELTAVEGVTALNLDAEVSDASAEAAKKLNGEAMAAYKKKDWPGAVAAFIKVGRKLGVVS